MAGVPVLHGELQSQLMAAMWRLRIGTVGQIRADLPARYRGAYTTIQTVLNRLADRRLLVRERQGRGFVYRPAISEAQYLSGIIRQTLAGASSAARRAALASIIGDMGSGELAELRARAAPAGLARTNPGRDGHSARHGGRAGGLVPPPL